MVAPFLNKNEIVDEEYPELEYVPNNLLDLSIRALFNEWSDTMLFIIDDIVEIFNSNDYLRWQDKYKLIGNTINKDRRLFYIGISLIFIALFLFYFELVI